MDPELIAIVLGLFTPVYVALWRINYKLGRLEHAVFNGPKCIGTKTKRNIEWEMEKNPGGNQTPKEGP